VSDSTPRMPCRTKLSVVLLLVAMSPSLAQTTVPEWRLARETLIDAAGHDLSPIHWLAVANDGTIAVSQEQDFNVRFFSSRGTPTLTFGRKGTGPGEFEAMTLHGWVGDTLWVGDFGARRLTLLRPAGTLVRTQLLPSGISFPETTPRPVPKFLAFPPWAMYGDGSVLVVAYPTGEQVPSWMNRPPGTLQGFLRVRRDGVFERVVTWAYEWSDACRVETNGRTLPRPLCVQPFYAVSRRGSLVVTVRTERSDAQNDYVRVTSVNARGDTLFANLLSEARQRVPRQVADSVRDAFVSLVRRRTPGAAVSVDIPDSYPPYEQAIVSSDDKHVWLERGVAVGDRLWKVFDLTGRTIGSVRVRRAVQLRAVSLERVWATERDADGLESIAVYRVIRPERSDAGKGAAVRQE
jgi:hypothetical protein